MIILLAPFYLLALILLLRRDRLRTIGGLGIATLAAGLLYWTIPYAKMQVLQGWFPIAFTGLAVAAGFGIARWTGLRWPKVAAVAAIGFVTAVTARVIVDLFGDPGSHDLAGIEVIFAFLVGFAGATFGWGAARWREG